MTKITLTRKLAYALGRDAGIRSARAAGRTAWNEDDWNAACKEFDRLWPVENDLRPVEDEQVAR